MMSLSEHINESVNKDTLSLVIGQFKDGEDTMLSMIAKRIEKWDANSGAHSREPMFLCDFNRQSMSWTTIGTLTIELGDGEGHIDGGTNYKMFDGFLDDYMSGKTTTNDQYILGVFMDRCFIPIPNKEVFENIWNKIVK